MSHPAKGDPKPGPGQPTHGLPADPDIEAPLPRASIRDLDPPERDAFATALHAFGDDILEPLGLAGTPKVLERPDAEPHRRVILVHRQRLADLAAFEPVFIGIPVAHLSRKGARLTLEGGRQVTPFATRRVVEVNEKGEQLFLYGRQLLGQSIQHVRGRVRAGDEVVVVSRATGRYLGIGIAAIPLGGPKGRIRDPNAAAVHHRLDLGLYLRAQQEVPE